MRALRHRRSRLGRGRRGVCDGPAPPPPRRCQRPLHHGRGLALLHVHVQPRAAGPHGLGLQKGLRARGGQLPGGPFDGGKFSARLDGRRRAARRRLRRGSLTRRGICGRGRTRLLPQAPVQQPQARRPHGHVHAPRADGGHGEKVLRAQGRGPRLFRGVRAARGPRLLQGQPRLHGQPQHAAPPAAEGAVPARHEPRHPEGEGGQGGHRAL